MNLSQTISIFGGGPGSGCHGPNCGRPEGHVGLHGPMAQPLPETVAYPLGSPGMMKLRKGEVAKLKPSKQLKPTIRVKVTNVPVPKSPAEYAQKYGRAYDPKTTPQEFKKVTVKSTVRNPEKFGKDLAKDSTAEMRQWQEQHPKQPTAPVHNIEEGDKVTLKQPMTTWVEKPGSGKGRLQTFPGGHEATVVIVNPRIGNAQTVSLMLHKHGEMEQALTSDIELSKKGAINVQDKINPETQLRFKPHGAWEIREGTSSGKVKQSYDMPDGSKYTLLKPRNMSDDEGPGRGNYIREHSLKGRFVATTPRVAGAVYNQRTQWFFGNKQGTPRGDATGTVVRVERVMTTKKTSIQEITQDRHGNWAMMRHYDYNNLGKASGFLNKRYGIRQKLKGKD